MEKKGDTSNNGGDLNPAYVEELAKRFKLQLLPTTKEF